MHTEPNPGQLPRIEDILITAELERRPQRAPDFAAENRAMAVLAAQVAADPYGVPQKLAELLAELCHADSAGVSLLEHQGGQAVFRWRGAAGVFASQLGGSMPAADSPCGEVVERNALMLLRDADRCYPALRAFAPRMEENLLAPWCAGGRASGTVWVISHTPERHFDAEDARVLQNLSAFAAAAYAAIAALDETEDARRQLAQRNERLEREVEQRRQAEAELRVSERHQRDLLACIPAAVYACQADGAMEFHNAGALALWGAAPEPDDVDWALRGGWRTRLPDGRLLAAAQAPMAAVLATGDPAVNQELKIERPDGTTIDVLVNITALRDRAGAITGAVSILEDITERKRADLALRVSEQKFRTLANTAPALIWQNDEEGESQFINQYFRDFVGADAEDILGSGWQSFLHPDDAAGYVARYREAMRARRPYSNHGRLRRHDGQWRWFDSYGQPLFGADGHYVGHVGVALDVTDAVQAQESLTEADRRKDEFLATLAHELRNPLAPISNAVHLLRRPGGRRKADSLVEMVGRQVRQIVKLVDDLLEVSRITRGKIVLDKRQVALAEVVEAAVETCRPLADAAGHALTVTLPQDPVMLDADSVRLTQVLANLLNNAARYTDAGGRIALTARREAEALIVSVRDNGIGIPADQLPHIFDMFVQAHRGAGRGQGGLGIGLAMVYKLVEMHGGSVEAHSAGPGKGSEFIVRLPLAPADADAPALAEPPPSEAGPTPLSGKRILVVDDNQDAAETLAMLLGDDGAIVDIVHDGAAALAALDTLRPDAVLLDLGMPGMDGIEVARRIRADPRLRHLRLAALTGWGQESDRARTREAGFDCHLTKPVDLHALAAWLLDR